MTWKSKAAAILTLAASVTLAFLVLENITGGSVALAQVVDKLRAARTLSFDWTITHPADGKVLAKGRNAYMVPGKLRVEYDGEQGRQSYVVLDTGARKVLFADEKEKTARVVPLKPSEGVDKAAQAIENIRGLKEQGAQPLENKSVDGTPAKGFTLNRGKETTTVWANAANGEPLRIEITDNNPDGPTVQVWTNIKVNPQLDPHLLSTTPPAGFRTTPSAPSSGVITPANSVAEFLKLYTKHMDGQFPQSLSDATKQLADKLRPANSNEPPGGDLLQLPFFGAAVAAATNHGGKGERWQYYPGQKLGDAKEVVFWLYDRRSNTYQAVYADLHVASIDKANLPPLSK